MALHQIEDLSCFKPAFKKDQSGAAEFCHEYFDTEK